MANTKAKSLVALLNQLTEGILAHKHANIASLHVRSSELTKALDLSANTPLVLSTISYVADDINKNYKKNYEQGELFSDGLNLDSDMEISGSDDEVVGLDISNVNSDVPKPKQLPYGVIEISSSILDKEKSDNLQTVDFLDAFGSIKYSTELNTNMSMSENLKSNPKKSHFDDDDDESVSIVHLT